MAIKDDSNSNKVLKLLLQSFNGLFFSYLTNRELGLLDTIITDVNLRQIYFKQAERFYLCNKIQSLDELNWILKRNINITKCHFDFDFEGKQNIRHIINNDLMYFDIVPVYMIDDISPADLYSRIASTYKDLIEISGSLIDDDGLLALSMVSHPSLTSFKFRKCEICDTSVTRLCKGCPLLKTLLLTCQDSELSDESIESIVKYCPGIERLSLGWTVITDASMAYLGTLTSLKHLNLSHCRGLTSNGVQSLLRRTGANLEELVLSDCDEDDDNCDFCDAALVQCIGECCPNLRGFVVQIGIESNMTDVPLITLVQRCPLLETFSVWCETLLITDVLLVALSEHCPHLSTLSLWYGGYTDAGVTAVAKKCTELMELELFGIADLTDRCLLSIAANCKQLQKFGLRDSNHYTDRGLCHLFDSCTQLTDIYLRSLSRMTGTILALAQCCRGMRMLELSHNAALTEKTIVYLVTLQQLETLTVGNCSSLSDHTLESVARYCPRLRTINIYGCPLITEKGLIALLTYGKRLRSIEIIGIKLTPETHAAYLTRRTSPHRLKVQLNAVTFWL